MNKIIVKLEEFKTAIEFFDAALKCETGNSNLHFYSRDGIIIEYHLPKCNEVKDPKYIKPLGMKEFISLMEGILLATYRI